MTDILIIGAGAVGAAIGYGLARQGSRVTLLDGDDTDHRAARAKFGVVVLQEKGASMPSCNRLTRRSLDGWQGFYDELARRSRTRLAFERDGGRSFCLSEDEFGERRFEATGRQPGEIGFYQARPPLKPVTGGELTTLGVSAPIPA